MAPGRAAAPALLARGLVKRFGRRDVLGGVDVALAPGEAALLVGPNGSGKTTLLRVLATLERPDGGSLSVAGVDALDDGAAARRRVGYAGHEPGLYPALTVRENLAFAASFLGAAARVEDALRAFRLERAADERAGALSRGTRQRAALARAFLGEPAVVLLDEPWTGLDDAAAAALEAALASALARGASALVSTHDPARGARVATRRLALDGGRLVEAAS